MLPVAAIAVVVSEAYSCFWEKLPVSFRDIRCLLHSSHKAAPSGRRQTQGGTVHEHSNLSLEPVS